MIRPLLDKSPVCHQASNLDQLWQISGLMFSCEKCYPLEGVSWWATWQLLINNFLYPHVHTIAHLSKLDLHTLCACDIRTTCWSIAHYIMRSICHDSSIKCRTVRIEGSVTVSKHLICLKLLHGSNWAMVTNPPVTWLVPRSHAAQGEAPFLDAFAASTNDTI